MKTKTKTETKRTIPVILLTLALLLTGCEEWATYTPSAYDLTRIAEEFPPGPTKDALQSTAVARYVEAEMAHIAAQEAQATADAANLEHQRQTSAMTAEAQAVERARAEAAQATRQALDAIERQHAIDATATAHVMSFNATATAQMRQATATCQAEQTTATAQSVEATRQAERATAQAYADQTTATVIAGFTTSTAEVQATQAGATAIAAQATQTFILEQEKRERWISPLLFLGTVVGTLALGACTVYVGYRLWHLIEDRGRVVRRRADEGEPLIMIDRERWGLPLRMFGPYADLTQGEENSPLLAPTVEAQEATTMRQQTVNAIHANQAADIARARSRHGFPARHSRSSASGTPRLPASFNPSRLRRPHVGLVDVVAVQDLGEAAERGVLPPGLVNAIEGQWTEVEG
jgi:chemotaxis protein histidine kinase CheA